MQCNCGAVTESIHKVVRDKVLQGEYQKCGSCGRIMWIWKSDSLKNELESTKSPTSTSVKKG